jgi:hypothetical protein
MVCIGSASEDGECLTSAKYQSLKSYISHPVSQKELLEQVEILSFYAYIPIKIPKRNKNAAKNHYFHKKSN